MSSPTRHYAHRLLASLLCIAIACKGESSSRTQVSMTGDTAVAAVNAPAPPFDSASMNMTVSMRGIGPLHTDMTLTQASSATGKTFELPANGDPSGCNYVRWPDGPQGVSLMVVNLKVVRVDVTSSTIATDEGARVGDTEAKVLSLYRGRVTISPHKYTKGHYLTVTSANADESDYRLVFETDEGIVTRYRSGRLPAVEYVEGCS